MTYRLAAAVATVVVGLALAGSGTAQAAPAAPAQADPSPAGCHIETIDNPHIAKSVPGAVKVNAKAQCNAPVPEQDLSVTLLIDGKPGPKTVAKATNKAFVLNQQTFVRCTNFTDVHTFQGIALGTSFEGPDGKPYLQTREGPSVRIACGV